MILELDDAPRIADALSRIRQMLLTLEINEALHRPTFRRLLRRLPDRLLQAVGENVGQPDLAKAAATALVVAMNPQDYGPEVSEKRALADFSRVIKTTGLHSIAKIDVKGSAAQAELKIRIWTQLLFQNGRPGSPNWPPRHGTTWTMSRSRYPALTWFPKIGKTTSRRSPCPRQPP